MSNKKSRGGMSFKNTLFNTVQNRSVQKNVFDLTHDVKMTGKMGNLMPVLCQEVLPNETFTLGADLMIRFAPLIAPVFHRMDATVHYFFVPNRILWENWEDYISLKATHALPVIEVSGALTADENRMLDYMGVPPWNAVTATTNRFVNALPFQAYQKIYNEYYRDQNLVSEYTYELVDGLNPASTLLQMRKRAWEHDYFTAALPQAQMGAPVDIPLGDVVLKTGWENNSTPFFEDENQVVGTGAVTQGLGEINVGATTDKSAYNPDGSLEVAPTTIQTLRRAFRLQEFLEKLMRSGKRYSEYIRAVFNTTPSDARLQRPEYITGTKVPVIVSEVLNTAGTFDLASGDPTSPPTGSMAGKALAIGNGFAGSFTSEEHGYIIGIMSVMPKPAYMQGIPRTFLRQDPLDFAIPEFAHIGEQEIYKGEIYAYQADDFDGFGYIPRYAEYKYAPNRVAGDFRNTLSYWTMVRKFATQPGLNQDFIEVDGESDNITQVFAVQDGTDYLWIQLLNKVRAVRPLPVFGNPML